MDVGRWGGGNGTLQVGPRAGWLGESVCQFRLYVCVCVVVAPADICACVLPLYSKVKQKCAHEDSDRIKRSQCISFLRFMLPH